MQKSSIKVLLASVMGSLAGLTPFESPFRAMPAKRYDHSYKTATPRPANNPAGSKLARKAAERRLTGNRMSQYGQGLLNSFAAKRGVRA